MEHFTTSNNYFFIKTIQVFDKVGNPLTEPILMEQVFGTFDSFRIYDGSFLHSDGKLYFFKRQYLKSNMEFYTQASQSASKPFQDESVQESSYLNPLQDPEEQYYPQKSTTTKKTRDHVYLQLYSLNLETGEQKPIPEVCIEEEDWDIQENESEHGATKKREKQSLGPMDPTRSQYHVQFSHEFGPKSIYECEVSYKNEWEFLSSQFFGI